MGKEQRPNNGRLSEESKPGEVGLEMGMEGPHGIDRLLYVHCVVAWQSTLLSMAGQMPPLPGEMVAEPRRWLSKPGIRVF